MPRVPALIALALLTLLAGVIRFTHLDRPCLWGDEALVYWRICGTFEQMLTPLKSDGFGPLHYELMWAISQFAKPTPIVLRLVPAICGTLLVPIIYFLARQMLPKSTSLLAAAFAVFSGFAIFYSRDAKMYMQTWCFAALGAGCLLWWLRSSRSTAWLGWVAAGCIACGTHATAMAVVALSPLLLLTQYKLHWRQALLMVAGLGLIFAGPVGYYTKFNQYIENIEEGGWRRSGIYWVEIVNDGMSGPELLRNAGTALLMGWTWPKATSEPRIPAGLLTWLKIASVAIAATLLLAALPWPRRWRNRDANPAPQPAWRVLLWLSCWIGLPGYAFYCHSVTNFQSPLTWPAMFVSDVLGGRWWIVRAGVSAVVTALVIAAFIRSTRPAARSATGKALVAAVMFGMLLLVYMVCDSLALDAMLVNRKWHSIWMPRYLGFLWPAIAIAVAALLMRLPTRPVRAAAIVMLLGINAALGVARFLAGTEPPVDQMAKDVFDAQDPNGAVRTYTDIPPADAHPGGGTILSLPGRYYLQLNAWQQPMSPQRFMRSLNEYSFRGGFHQAMVVQDLGRSPKLTRVIKWDDFSSDGLSEVPPIDDTLTASLTAWRLVSDRWYPVHAYWSWQRRGNFRRREYEKIGAAMGERQ